MIGRLGPTAALLLFLAGANAEGAEPLKLRIGWAVVPGQLTALIFAKPDLLPHYGKSYTADLVRFRGSAPQITALAAGELDLAALAFSSFGLAIQNAGMSDLRVVGDLYQDGIDGYYANEYMVRADSGIEKLADLKGKVLATNGLGGAVDMGLRKMLRDHGLEDRRDVRIIEIQFPNMVAALEEKKVDLVGLVTPFSRQARESGKTRTLFTMKDAMGETQTTLLAARAAFIAAHRAALVDFFEDWQRALRWFYDPAHRGEALAVLAAVTKEPAGDFADWVFTKEDYYRDPEGRPNLAALQHNLDLQKELGFLKIAIPVAQYADLSLVDEAARRGR